MTSYSFFDDYSEGCHPEILQALADHNLDQQLAYGADDYTVAACRLIAQQCAQPDVPVHLVGGGTLANLIVCAATLRPHEAIISAPSGHIAQREAGAIEATGHKIITAPATNGKLTASVIADAVASNAQGPHMAKPRLVYVSNATELGTVYTRSELHALRTACDEHGLLLLVDGARLGVALAAEHAAMTLSDVAELADIFWIGGTKAGALFGEAIVIPNAQLATEFAYHIKQRGALLAKGRALGLQFRALFSNGLFERTARTANSAALTLSTGIVAAGHDLAAPTESNQVFPILPKSLIQSLQQDFNFHIWEDIDDSRAAIRLVTSWATDSVWVQRFLQLL